MIKDIENEVSGDELLDNFFDRIGITPDVGFARFRFDKSSLFRRSDNPYMRSASEKSQPTRRLVELQAEAHRFETWI